MSIRLIVGLGNPGPEYAATRHNVGWWWLDKLCDELGVELKPNSKFKGKCASANIASCTVHLLRPETYMNLSGESVQALAKFYKIDTKDILVIHDELDLKPGTIRFKVAGGHGGHNGLRSIIQNAGNNKFTRLRIGIGHPGHSHAVESFVLSKPKKEDLILISNSIDKSFNHLDDIVSGKFPEVMQELNQKKQ